MNEPAARFDRDLTLPELLGALPRNKLEHTLRATLGDNWRIVDDTGAPLMGQGTGEMTGVSLRIEFEPLGQLQARGVPPERIDTAAAWLQMLLAAACRYRMAADLHLEAIHADYEALQRKHAALQESEARYRELSAQLDQRVKQQVAMIERTQRRLYQAEKMASVGSLAAGMAHEINNPVGFIRSNIATATGYLDKMRQALETTRSADRAAVETAWSTLDIEFILQDFPGLLSESASGADRIARIVANLKAFASIDVADATPVDLNEGVRAVVEIVKDRLPQDVALEIDTKPLPKIACDPSRINQVLFALMENARQALDKGGIIRIATRFADGEIRISIADNGKGIRPEIMNRIFDPFFTTHDVGKGMGMGLTVSRDIVAAHQGRIDVRSELGRGSVFTVCLPIADEAGEADDIGSPDNKR